MSTRTESCRSRLDPWQLSSTTALGAATLSIGLLGLAGAMPAAAEPASRAELGFVEVGGDLTLRRMVVRHPQPQGVVLFLHGFPETLYAWKEIASALGDDHEVHAFDWPGYGQSSRPSIEQFSYAPKDYARVLKAYIQTAGIDTSKLLIYATDIGALPALLLALEQPDIARTIVVGDFAPFDRPQYMYPSLQSLKSKPTSDATRAYMNKTKDEILENAFRRGLSEHEQFEVSKEFRDDMSAGWSQSGMTSADAFYHYYSHFTRDQNDLEAHLARLKTPVKVIWGEKDIYIDKGMGVEFAGRIGTKPSILAGIGHYPHLQRPKTTVEDVRALVGK